MNVGVRVNMIHGAVHDLPVVFSAGSVSVTNRFLIKNREFSGNQEILYHPFRFDHSLCADQAGAVQCFSGLSGTIQSGAFYRKRSVFYLYELINLII